MAGIGSLVAGVGGSLLGNLFKGSAPKVPQYNQQAAANDLSNFNSNSQGLYTNQYQAVNPVATANQAVNFDMANIGNFGNEAASLNQSALNSRLSTESQINPQWQSQSNQAAANASSELAGNIPLDVQQQVANSSAFKSYQNGYSGSPSGRSGLLARDLGMTSLGLTNMGQTNATNLANTNQSLLMPKQVTGADIMQQQGLTPALTTQTAESNAANTLAQQNFNVNGLQNIATTDLNTQLKLLSQQLSDQQNQFNGNAASSNSLWSGIGSGISALGGGGGSGGGSSMLSGLGSFIGNDINSVGSWAGNALNSIGSGFGSILGL
jgi:hypothetical protein